MTEKQHYSEKQPYSDFLGIEITEANANYAKGRLKVLPELTDMLTHMTGGAYGSLADAVGGAAARATGDIYVTQCCSLQYYVSTEVSDEYLYGYAEVRHRGSRTCIVAVELRHADGTVVCDGQYSYSKI